METEKLYSPLRDILYCPKCGKRAVFPFEADCIDVDVQYATIYIKRVGQCDFCKTKLKWTERFKFWEVKNLEIDE